LPALAPPLPPLGEERGVSANPPLPLGEGLGVTASSPLPLGEELGVTASSPLPLGEGLGVRVELVDVEGLYAPGFARPEALPSGSSGYAHRAAQEGLWGPTADRFAGAILLAEILGWGDETVREACYGETYFDPGEMPSTNSPLLPGEGLGVRAAILVSALVRHYGQAVADLFERAWKSETLADCPTFGEWLVALPLTLSPQPPSPLPNLGEGKGATEQLLGEGSSAAVAATAEIRVFMQAARRMEEKGNLENALELYRQAWELASADPSLHSLAREIELVVRELEQRAAYVAQAESQRYVSSPVTQAESLRYVSSPVTQAESRRDAALAGVRAEPRRRNWLWVGLGGLVGLALLVGLLIRGLAGDGLLATLATETPTPIQAPYPMEITDAYGVAMRLVPAGEFSMGSDADDALSECQKYIIDCQRNWFIDEEPLHTVYLDTFYMDEYEVTNAMYAACVKAGACTPPHADSSATRDSYYGNEAFDNYPVIAVDWNQAKTYCEWRGARLPTEAEWEKAARGLDGRIYPWGNRAPTCSLANFEPFDGNECVGDTSAVGSYPQVVSPYGIYDLAGNVWEWVADWYDEHYYANSPYRNPSGPESGKYRVLRGGSWKHNEINLRASLRLGSEPDYWLSYLGFRCSRSP